MCEYCGVKSKTERERLIQDAENFNKQLEKLGQYYTDAAAGKVKHHDEKDDRDKYAGQRARLVIRRLVNDWI